MRESKSRTGARINHFALTAAGALAIGVIGSGIWDLLAKPGLNRVADTVTRVASLGSQQVNDLAFSSAALDPAPLSGLLILYLLAYVPVVLAGAVWASTYLQPVIRRRVDASIEAALAPVRERSSPSEEESTLANEHKELETAFRNIERKLQRRSTLRLIACLGLIFVAALTAFSVINRAILTRRVFLANVAILSSRISNETTRTLIAKFALVETERDYRLLEREMRALANANGLSLRPETGQ